MAHAAVTLALLALAGPWSLVGLRAAPPAPSDAESSRHSLRLNVLVVNRANIAPETLAIAESRAARIYGQAGIEIAWHHIAVGGKPAKAVAPPEPRHLVIVYMSSTMMEAQLNLPREVMGFTARHSQSANVLAGHTERLARDTGTSFAEMLGHAIAHEIGHILLPGHPHSPTGIMSVRLDTRHIAQGTLLFSSQQRSLIRERVRSLAP